VLLSLALALRGVESVDLVDAVDLGGHSTLVPRGMSTSSVDEPDSSSVMKSSELSSSPMALAFGAFVLCCDQSIAPLDSLNLLW
jgi:hypothetical protein